jgi:hypothetical protein
LGKYKSRQAYRRTKALNPILALPSLRSVVEWKNVGEISSGVDEEVLKDMAKLAANSVELKHGVLSFDEVSSSFRMFFSYNCFFLVKGTPYREARYPAEISTRVWTGR